MKKRSLILSTALLLVAIMACTSATYAWFTSNTDAKVNTITASVDAQSSLLISGAAVAPAYGSDAWDTALDVAELETLNGTELLDRSSVDGVSFFSRAVNGDNSITYSEAADGYIEFSVHLVSSSSGNLIIKECDFKSLKGAEKAARIAVSCGGVTKIWEPDATAGTVKNDGFASTNVEAIASTTPTKAEQTTIADLEGVVITGLEATKSKTVTFRIWLEGEDAECANAITGDAQVETFFTFGMEAPVQG